MRHQAEYGVNLYAFLGLRYPQMRPNVKSSIMEDVSFSISTAALITGVERETIKNWRRRGFIVPTLNGGKENTVTNKSGREWDKFNKYWCAIMLSARILTEMGISLEIAFEISTWTAIEYYTLNLKDPESIKNANIMGGKIATIVDHKIVQTIRWESKVAGEEEFLGKISLNFSNVAAEIDRRIAFLDGMRKNTSKKKVKADTEMVPESNDGIGGTPAVPRNN